MANEEYGKVSEVIEKEIKPFIEADGGIIQLKDVDDGVVSVRLSGACAGCPGAAMTLKGGIEKILMMKLKFVKEVKLVH